MDKFNKVLGVDYDTDRWAEGIPHHHKSRALMERLAEIDFHCFGDYFCWKFGGDGDNGETMMYEMDVYFDEQDKKDPHGMTNGGLIDEVIMLRAKMEALQSEIEMLRFNEVVRIEPKLVVSPLQSEGEVESVGERSLCVEDVSKSLDTVVLLGVKHATPDEKALSDWAERMKDLAEKFGDDSDDDYVLHGYSQQLSSNFSTKLGNVMAKLRILKRRRDKKVLDLVGASENK